MNMHEDILNADAQGSRCLPKDRPAISNSITYLYKDLPSPSLDWPISFLQADGIHVSFPGAFPHLYVLARTKTTFTCDSIVLKCFYTVRRFIFFFITQVSNVFTLSGKPAVSSNEYGEIYMLNLLCRDEQVSISYWRRLGLLFCMNNQGALVSRKEDEKSL